MKEPIRLKSLSKFESNINTYDKTHQQRNRHYV